MKTKKKSLRNSLSKASFNKDSQIFFELNQRHQLLNMEHQRGLLSIAKWAKSWVDFTPGEPRPKVKTNPNKEYLYNIRLVNAVEKLRKVEKKIKLLDKELSDHAKQVSEKLDKFRSHKPKGSKQGKLRKHLR